MYIIRKQFRIEMAHQLARAYSKCCTDTIHGHSYVIELLFQRETLNGMGMVLDFGEVKQFVGPVLQEFDHALLLPNTLPSEYTSMLMRHNKKVILVDYNPTAEAFAEDLYQRIHRIFLSLFSVRVHETETGWAEFREDA